jgi:hypothetical protein
VTERVMVLNHTGTLVWQWCDGTRNREEILQKLGEEFGDLDREAAGHDLESFYQELDAMGFLVS